MAAGIAGGIATFAPILAAAANLIPPPAGQVISAAILSAAPILGGFAAIAPLLSQGLRALAESGVFDPTADADALERSRTVLFEEMKLSINKMQEMQTALSDVLKAMHDTAMSSIRNIK